MDAVAKDAIRALAAKNRPRGAVNSVMQLVDWHSNRHLPLPLFVVEAFALALGLDAYLSQQQLVTLSLIDKRSDFGNNLAWSLDYGVRW